ncbi:hypothetical protein L7F22_028690 [Adiantum nelumboides]|nr:hypothetical protein [Adiantum nelumboides]
MKTSMWFTGGTDLDNKFFAQFNGYINFMGSTLGFLCTYGNVSDNLLVIGATRVISRTLTSPVKFETCISAIKENAFVKSHHPLIITMEDHLPVDLQAKAAKVCKMLHKDWMIKRCLSCPFLARLEAINNYYRYFWVLTVLSTLSARASTVSFTRAADRKNFKYQRNHPKSIVNLAFKSSRNMLGKTRIMLICWAMKRWISFRFTRDNILRIYPQGWRVDSSNYNPMKAWLVGAQMVAVNTQGYGKHLWVGQGFFRANGGCGYVNLLHFFRANEHPSASRMIMRFAIELAGKPYDLSASSNASRITKRLADGCSEEHPSASHMVMRLAIELGGNFNDLSASSNANRITKWLAMGARKIRVAFSVL